MKLKVIRNSTGETLGTITMSERRWEELSSFDDHKEKPMNVMLKASEIAELEDQNVVEEDEEARFFEDDEITLEAAE